MVLAELMEDETTESAIKAISSFRLFANFITERPMKKLRLSTDPRWDLLVQLDVPALSKNSGDLCDVPESHHQVRNPAKDVEYHLTSGMFKAMSSGPGGKGRRKGWSNWPHWFITADLPPSYTWLKPDLLYCFDWGSYHRVEEWWETPFD